MGHDNSPKVVMITGASAGLGRATARAFAERGARIGLLARDAGALTEVGREVQKAGGKAMVVPADVADADAVDEAASKVESEFGPIDVWVNNAMVAVFSPFRLLEPLEFRRATEVTYLGCVHGTMAALKRMRHRDRGIIIQVGSALAYRSIPLQAAYCGAKHAIVGFTDSLRSELIHDDCNVRLTVVHMPALNTPQFDWGRNRMERKAQPVPPIFQPEVGADAIVWASDRYRREVYVGMSTFKAIWGQKFIPGLLDRYLARNAFDGQQRDVADEPDRPDNLYQFVAGDFGAHGSFDDRARDRSLALKAVKARGWLWLFAAVVLLTIMYGVLAAL